MTTGSACRGAPTAAPATGVTAEVFLHETVTAIKHRAERRANGTEAQAWAETEPAVLTDRACTVCGDVLTSHAGPRTRMHEDCRQEYDRERNRERQRRRRAAARLNGAK